MLDERRHVTCRFSEFDAYLRAFTGINREGRTVFLKDNTAAWNGLPRKEGFEIVVARYCEDLAWTEVVGENVTVYNKGPDDGRWNPLSNVGREFGTYLHHIVQRWGSLAEQTLFVQGDPFVHPLYPLPMYLESDFVSFLSNVKDLGGSFLSASAKEAFWRRYIRAPMPYYTSYSVGAQFSASARLVHRRGLPFWKDLLDLSQSAELRFADCGLDNYGIGILFEYFWPHIMNVRQLSVQSPIPIEARF